MESALTSMLQQVEQKAVGWQRNLEQILALPFILIDHGYGI
jgi:hypothetical protein